MDYGTWIRDMDLLNLDHGTWTRDMDHGTWTRDMEHGTWTRDMDHGTWTRDMDHGTWTRDMAQPGPETGLNVDLGWGPTWYLWLPCVTEGQAQGWSKF